MGRGTAGSPRATQCLIATITNIVAHVLLLLVCFYYIAAKRDIETDLALKLLNKRLKGKITDKEFVDGGKGIESRVETGPLISGIYGVVHILVLVGVLFVILRKKDAKLLRVYANGAGLLFVIFIIVFQFVLTIAWDGGLFELLSLVLWICGFAAAFNVAASERYRRELLLRGNAGGRNRGWATPRPDVEQDLSAANVNDQAAPASNEAAAPEGDQNAGSA